MPRAIYGDISGTKKTDLDAIEQWQWHPFEILQRKQAALTPGTIKN